MRPELEELLLEIVDLPEERREPALVLLCQRYPADADYLRRCYDNYRRLEEGSAVASAAMTTPSSPQTPPIAPPAVIGPYQVLGMIGQGGMGTVYRAERLHPVRLTVAIKVVRQGLSSREVLARFDLERRALAAMNHRCIARIFDAGATDRGEPYFVMELVEGVALTTYCDRHRLDVSARLVLFQHVCAAVQHAHQKGVVHRDLKPGNVLVVRDGHEHVPKVLDFGLAKATALEDESAGQQTLQGQVLGTPEYMAPEQVLGVAAVIDARADIYSLGVMLFELLSGVLPFPIEVGNDTLQLLRSIAERRPVRPSSVLARSGDAVQLAVLRQTNPSALLRVLRRDLDWVVLKAMASEPERRYDSAAALAMDLQRYCNHEPVLAGPPSTAYRLAKFVRRYRGEVFAVGAVFLTAVVGGLLALGFAFEARERQVEAQASERRAVASRERLGHTLDREREARATAEARDYSARIAAAAAALRGGDVAAATRHLDLAPPALRGFEWRYYRARLDDSEETLAGPMGTVRCFAFDPFGRWFASGGQDSQIRVWDAATRQLIAVISQPSLVVGLDSSPDGTRLLVTRERHSVALLDVASGQLISGPRIPGVNHAVWQPGGQLLAVTRFNDPEVHLLDARTGHSVGQCHGHEKGCTFLAFDRTGQRLLSASLDRTMRVWDVATRTMLAETAPQKQLPVRVHFLGDGSQFVSALEGVLAIWNTASGELLREVDAPMPAWGLAATRDGGTIATGAWDGTVRLWSEATLRGRLLVGHLDRQVSAVAFTPGEDRLLSGAQDIKVWPVHDDANGVIAGVPGHWMGLALSPDGRLLAEAGGPNDLPGSTEVPRLTLRDARGRQLWTLELAEGRQPEVLSFDRSGAFLIAGSKDGFITVFEVSSRRELRAFLAHPRVENSRESTIINGLAMSPDGKCFATSSRSDVVKLWSWPECSLLRTIQVPKNAAPQQRITSLHWNSDGTRIVTCHWNGALHIVDPMVGTALPGMRGHTGDTLAVAFSPDGGRIASASTDGTVRLWSATDGAELAVLRGHTDHVRAVAFSPDGRRLVSGGDDSTLRLWDVASGHEVARLDEHRGSVGRVLFSPDGERIYSKDTEGQIRIWDTEGDPGVRELPEDLRDVARRARLTEERADDLLSTWPPSPAAFRDWLDRDWASLVASKPLLATAIETIRKSGHAGGASAAMPDLFGRVAQRARDEARLAALQRAQATRHGEPFAAFSTPAEWQAMTAAELYTFAGPFVHPVAEARKCGREAEALAALRLAHAKIAAGDTSMAATAVLVAVAFAEFDCGRDQAALDAMAAAAAATPEADRAPIGGQLERLVDAVSEAGQRGDREVAELAERLLAKDDWSFTNADDALHHAALCRIAAAIETIEQNHLPRIRHRQTAALRGDEAQADQGASARRWEQARAAILRADGEVASRDYARSEPIELSPQLGLVPLGMNPRTRLWEFYHIDSALDPRVLPQVDPITGDIAVTGDTGIVFVLVPGGEFTLEDEPATFGATPPQQVVLDPFFVARHELTQGQYERLSAGSLPSRLRSGLHYPGAAAPCTRSHPVESIAWSPTVALLRSHGLDLPTAAQWQVARGEATAGPVAVWPQAVGCLPANALGLHDMCGNVAEMCLDWQSSNTLPRVRGTGLRQVAEVGASRRVVCGGSFLLTRPNEQAGLRVSVAPDQQRADVGCRAVRVLIVR